MYVYDYITSVLECSDLECKFYGFASGCTMWSANVGVRSVSLTAPVNLHSRQFVCVLKYCNTSWKFVGTLVIWWFMSVSTTTSAPK